MQSKFGATASAFNICTASLMMGLLNALTFGAWSHSGEDDSDDSVHPLVRL